MAVSKGKTLLIRGCLLMSLLLSGCGGQSLSDREIVRGVFFTRQDEVYSACLVLADQAAETGQSANKIAAATGSTPAQALQHAEQSLYGEVYYGLLDLAVLPWDTDWETAQEIGELLYENAQPAPELSVFLLGRDPVRSWAEEAPLLYNNLKAVEQTYKVHCGLQQLFTQRDVCGIPAYAPGGGYSFAILPRDANPVYYDDSLSAQLAAVLCGQTTHLQTVYAGGSAVCKSRVQVTVEDARIQLHFRNTEWQDLTGGRRDLPAMLREELQEDFAALWVPIHAAQVDPFHLEFWQACLYGPEATIQNPTLEIIFA